MTVTIQLAVNKTPVPSTFYDAITQMEVEESSDQPGTLLLRLPVNRTSAGDLQFVGDGTFEPMTNVTLTLTPGALGSARQCVFDGYVLSWRLHLDRASTSSTIEIWAQDASWRMNLDDHVVEWSGMTDGEIANKIFLGYGFKLAAGNIDNDSPKPPARRAHAGPARDGPAVPARPGPARREAVPRRLHQHARHPDRVFRGPGRNRPAGGDDLPA